jgi:hypothetical protein
MAATKAHANISDGEDFKVDGRPQVVGPNNRPRRPSLAAARVRYAESKHRFDK